MRNASSTTESILERLQQAADSLERSAHRGGHSFRRFYRDSRSAAGDAQGALHDEWESIKADLAQLMDNADLSRSPEVRALVERIRGSVHDASESMSEMAHNARRRAREQAEAVDEYVHESPWTTAGVAAVAGLAIGLLLAVSATRR